MYYCETSAKEATNVDQAFSVVAKKAMEKAKSEKYVPRLIIR